MFEGDNVYPMFSSSVRRNRLQYDTEGIPLQLFGDSRVGCNIGSLNCEGVEHNPLTETARGVVEVGSLSRERKHPISVNNKSFHDNVGQSGYVPNMVSTGLRLSCEEDDPNSAVTSASKGIKATLPIILSLDDNLKVEIDQQKKELDCYIRFQEENTIKGLRELRLRHMVSFLSAIERGVSRKLYEKELEIENMNNKNQELLEKMKQVSMELQSWQFRAKYNESAVNALKNNLQQVMAQCVMRGKEAHGDREIEEVASCTNTGYQGVTEHAGDSNSFKRQMNCRACKVKEVCVLMLPCRHLCLCKDCEVFIDICPVCGIMKTASVEVIMS
ncbi:probable BOI-related E3 ubiquitin-protein ligase 2 [Neltuma alba]|uniref:probable BOI-related E3 ubiquitin-protein ligase 2 n=1 Tax=Neltuma alba TaxID=207710 RepID=UPI0010A3A11D|nr:probable BOI-related E3 ubiquitin-protein ligase 2 [Prosopis alba]